MLVHRKVTPQHYDRRYPFIHLGEERQCGIKFLVQGNNTTAVTRLEPPTSRSEVQHANHLTTAPPRHVTTWLRHNLVMPFRVTIQMNATERSCSPILFIFPQNHFKLCSAFALLGVEGVKEQMSDFSITWWLRC